MRPSTQLVGPTAFTLLATSFASSLQPDCEVVTTGLSSSCWATLNMSTWITKWAASTSPNATNGTAAKCQEQESWSVCFLRLGLEVTGLDCSNIDNTSGDNSTCPTPRLGDAPHMPQLFYGVWNIYAINSYTTTLILALQTLSQTNNSVAITTAATVSPNGLPRFSSNSTKTLSIDVPLRVLLEKETYGFALPFAPNAGFLAFLETYPVVQRQQMYSRSTGVLELVALMRQRLGQVLMRVMSDVTSFVLVAGGGAFSTGEVVDEMGLVEAWET